MVKELLLGEVAIIIAECGVCMRPTLSSTSSTLGVSGLTLAWGPRAARLSPRGPLCWRRWLGYLAPGPWLSWACVSHLASPHLGVNSPAQTYLGEVQTEHVIDPVVDSL